MAWCIGKLDKYIFNRTQDIYDTRVRAKKYIAQPTNVDVDAVAPSRLFLRDFSFTDNDDEKRV
jgi:hypothetical protein